MDVTERFYGVNGIQLHTLEKGKDVKGVMLLLHGFPEPALAWRAQLDYFSERGYRVVAPNERGYDKSSKPIGVKAYTMETLVADMVALVQQLTNEKVILVGHDWGGAVAWQLAMLYPHLIRRLIIINMPHPAVLLTTLRKSNKQKIKSAYVAFFQLPLLPEAICKAFHFYFLKRTLTTSSIQGTFSTVMLCQYTEAWRREGALTAMLNWYRAYRHSRLSPKGTVTVPALIIWGKKDKFLSSEMAEASVKKCTDGKLVMDAGSTHWIHHEKPAFISRQIEAFIDEVR